MGYRVPQSKYLGETGSATSRSQILYTHILYLQFNFKQNKDGNDNEAATAELI